MVSIKHLFSLSVLLATLTTSAQIKFQKISLEEAKEQAQQQNKEIFIDFWAIWCKPCLAMEKETFSDPEVGKAINSKYIPIKIDVDYFDGMDAKEMYNVGVLPTILIINANGDVQRRLLGQKSPASLMQELNLPYYGSGGTIVDVDPTEQDAGKKKHKKESKFRRWWRSLWN